MPFTVPTNYCSQREYVVPTDETLAKYIAWLKRELDMAQREQNTRTLTTEPKREPRT